MNRPRGRPPKDIAAPSREAMVLIALHFLDTEGVQAFTMRALASQFGVNAMTIYHHFGDRGGLIEAMADHVYARVTSTNAESGLDRITDLMLAYHAQVVRHPGLALLIFSEPLVFPKQAQRITDSISRILIDAGMASQKSQLWVGILVDFTHGAAVATAMMGQSQPETPGIGSHDDFASALRELVAGLRGRL